MLNPNDMDKLMLDLEQQELEAPGGVAGVPVYAQLLAIYLYQNDLNNAKYLWKRIPASVKSSNPELEQIWNVGQNLWKRDFPATYQALNAVTWSDSVLEIMKSVQLIVRTRAVDLISQAYSSISIDNVVGMTGLPAQMCIQACLEKNWTVDPDGTMVYPVKQVIEHTVPPNSEDQLYKLTDFVSFLEN